MNGTTHRLGGMAFGAMIPAVMTLTNSTHQLDTPQIASFIAGAAIGSLLPDFDHPGSLIGRKAKLVSTAVRKVAGHRGATHYLITLLAYSIGVFILLGYIERWLHEKNATLAIGIVDGMIFTMSAMFVLKEVSRITKTRIKSKHITMLTIASFLFGLAFTLYDTKSAYVLITSYLVGSIAGYFSHLFLDSFTVSGLQWFQPFFKFEVHLGHCRTGSDWHNHKRGDTAEDRKKARGFGEAAYAFACGCLFFVNIAIIFGVQRLFL